MVSLGENGVERPGAHASGPHAVRQRTEVWGAGDSGTQVIGSRAQEATEAADANFQFRILDRSLPARREETPRLHHQGPGVALVHRSVAGGRESGAGIDFESPQMNLFRGLAVGGKEARPDTDQPSCPHPKSRLLQELRPRPDIDPPRAAIGRLEAPRHSLQHEVVPPTIAQRRAHLRPEVQSGPEADLENDHESLARAPSSSVARLKEERDDRHGVEPAAVDHLEAIWARHLARLIQIPREETLQSQEAWAGRAEL